MNVDIGNWWERGTSATTDIGDFLAEAALEEQWLAEYDAYLEFRADYEYEQANPDMYVPAYLRSIVSD